MNDVRVGAAFRAVRIRPGWRQSDVARRAGAAPGVVSLIERGHLDRVSLPALRRVAAKLEIRLELVPHLRHGELDRLVNAGHAALHEAVASHLRAIPGWTHAAEVSFSFYGERGVIDVLGFHEPTGALLVVELKTELVSLENLLATMDVRLRHATRIARDRGWHAGSVSRWVVIAASATNRRRVRDHRATLQTAFPADGRRMRAWLAAPNGPIRGLSFWANFSGTTRIQDVAARRRVRVRAPAPRRALTRTLSAG